MNQIGRFTYSCKIALSDGLSALPPIMGGQGNTPSIILRPNVVAAPTKVVVREAGLATVSYRSHLRVSFPKNRLTLQIVEAVATRVIRSDEISAR